MFSFYNGYIFIIGVSKYYGCYKVLDDVLLEIFLGMVMVIFGFFGLGKFMLLCIINYFEWVDEGFIQIDGDYIGYCCKGDKLYEMKEKEIFCQWINVGYVFQNFNLFLYLMVLENLIEVLIVYQQVMCKEVIVCVYELLDVVGLCNKVDVWLWYFFGGQQQCIVIVWVLVLNLWVILFDEFILVLDFELVGEVLDVIKKLV